MHKHLHRARVLTELLDTKFKVLGIRFGLDPIFNLIPGIGGIIGTLTSLYLFWIGYKLNANAKVYLRMLLNIIIDFVLSSIPVVGIVFDTFYRSNVRNLKVLENFTKI